MARRIAFYRIKRGDDLGDPEHWNKRYEDIDLRIASIEAALKQIDGATDELVTRGLQLVRDQVQEAVANVLTVIASAEGRFDTQIAIVQGAIEGLDSAIDAAEQAVDQIEQLIKSIVEEENIPAAGIILDPIVGLVAGNVQAALAEHQDSLASLALALSEHGHGIGSISGLSDALASKADSEHGHAIGDVSGLGDALADKASTASVAGKADSAITVTGEGLASGGGSLTDNRIITVPRATAAQFRGKTDDAVALTPKQVFDAAAPVTLTDAGTIAVNMANGLNFEVTINGNRTLGNPTNVVPGTCGTIYIAKTAASLTLAFASNWKFPGGTAPSLSTASGTVDALHWYARTASFIEAALAKDVK